MARKPEAMKLALRDHGESSGRSADFRPMLWKPFFC
jgi:hypothetical protein